MGSSGAHRLRKFQNRTRIGAGAPGGLHLGRARGGSHQGGGCACRCLKSADQHQTQLCSCRHRPYRLYRKRLRIQLCSCRHRPYGLCRKRHRIQLRSFQRRAHVSRKLMTTTFCNSARGIWTAALQTGFSQAPLQALWMCLCHACHSHSTRGAHVGCQSTCALACNQPPDCRSRAAPHICALPCMLC